MLRIVLIAITVFAAIGAGTVGAVFAGYNAYKSQLPSAATITNMEPQIDTSVYDSTGGLIHVFHNQGYRHIHVDLNQISPYFKEAIVAIEDHNFYTEGSWDLARLVESGVADVTHRGASLQGGSTITEQLAKISLYGGADPPQSIDYKIKEIVLGNEIALNFTKSEILDMYVNRIFYGNFALGVGQRGRALFPEARERARSGPGRVARRASAVPVGLQPAHSQRARRSQSARQVPSEGGAPGNAVERLHHAGAGHRGIRRERVRPYVQTNPSLPSITTSTSSITSSPT